MIFKLSWVSHQLYETGEVQGLVKEIETKRSGETDTVRLYVVYMVKTACSFLI
jgi:hypothetical protein